MPDSPTPESEAQGQPQVGCSAWLACGVASAEFLIAQWEARADELEAAHRRIRDEMQHLAVWHLEKARAYRACIADLRRHAEAVNVRQPEANIGLDE